jgi:hypothetical protein
MGQSPHLVQPTPIDADLVSQTMVIQNTSSIHIIMLKIFLN